MESECWEAPQRASYETLAKRLASPATVHLAATNGTNPRIVGYIGAVLHAEAGYTAGESWRHYAQLAEAATAPNPAASVCSLYIVTISIHSGAARGTGTELVKALCELGRRNGLKFVRYGIRLPHLSHHVKNGVSPARYVEQLASGAVHEDVYRLAIKSGGTPRSLIPDYYQDSASLNYGLLMEHFLQTTRDCDG